MYAALWRLLPGRRLAKTFEAALLAAVVVVVLFLWVFQAAAPRLTYPEDVTISSDGAAS
jgi:FlaA1/EpsC-like NDP-sugar epimerase